MRATQESPKPLTQSLTGKARARFVRFGPAGVLQRIVIWKRMGRFNIVPSYVSLPPHPSIFSLSSA